MPLRRRCGARAQWRRSTIPMRHRSLAELTIGFVQAGGLKRAIAKATELKPPGCSQRSAAERGTHSAGATVPGRSASEDLLRLRARLRATRSIPTPISTDTTITKISGLCALPTIQSTFTLPRLTSANTSPSAPRITPPAVNRVRYRRDATECSSSWLGKAVRVVAHPSNHDRTERAVNGPHVIGAISTAQLLDARHRRAHQHRRPRRRPATTTDRKRHRRPFARRRAQHPQRDRPPTALHDRPPNDQAQLPLIVVSGKLE